MDSTMAKLSYRHHKLCGLCLSCTRLTTDEDCPERQNPEDVSIPTYTKSLFWDRKWKSEGMKDMKVQFIIALWLYYGYMAILVHGLMPSYPLFTRLVHYTPQLGIQLTLLSVTDAPVGGVRCVEDMPRRLGDRRGNSARRSTKLSLSSTREAQQLRDELVKLLNLVNLLLHLISSYFIWFHLFVLSGFPALFHPFSNSVWASAPFGTSCGLVDGFVVMKLFKTSNR